MLWVYNLITDDDDDDAAGEFFFESSAVAGCSDGGLRAGLQYTSHHPERPSLVVRSVESIFSLLCPGMYFAVTLMAAGLSCMSPVFSAAIYGELLRLISTRVLFCCCLPVQLTKAYTGY